MSFGEQAMHSCCGGRGFLELADNMGESCACTATWQGHSLYVEGAALHAKPFAGITMQLPLLLEARIVMA